MTPTEKLVEELGTVRDKVGCFYDDVNEAIQSIKYAVEDLEEMQTAIKKIHDMLPRRTTEPEE
jgi:hypothetical protein